MKTLNIGLLGLGQIGGGVYKILTQKSSFLTQKSGVGFKLKKIADKDLKKRKEFGVRKEIFTTNCNTVINHSEIDIVIELIGGIHPAREIIIRALKNGKHVITANKALLAEYSGELFRIARKFKRQILFEASVGGGIPVIKSLREGLIINRINTILGIINGTSNYILTKMSQEGLEFKNALALAQAKGYAETNPRLDIDGTDSAHKLCILTSLAFGGEVKFRDIYCEGIDKITKQDISFVKNFGYVIKLLAIAKETKEGIEARVQPTLLPKDHILAKVDGAFNAILFNGSEVGEILLYGRGAGRKPTASAVISDLVDLAKTTNGVNAYLPLVQERKLKLKGISKILSRYYLRLTVIDKPGVLSKIAGCLGRKRVSISEVMQLEQKAGNIVPVIMLTHHATEKSVRAAVSLIDRLNVVKQKTQVLRIES